LPPLGAVFLNGYELTTAMASVWLIFLAVAALTVAAVLLLIRKRAKRDDLIVQERVAQFQKTKTNYSDTP
jgi:hypothetical protein